MTFMFFHRKDRSTLKCESGWLSYEIKRSARMNTSVRGRYCFAITLGSAKWSKSLMNEGFRELKCTCPLCYATEHMIIIPPAYASSWTIRDICQASSHIE